MPGYGLTGQLKGLAWTGMTCVQPPIPVKQFQFYYPNGLPAIRTVVRGALLYDPRDGATRWTRNPALIALDYLTAYKTDASGTKVPRGMGIPISRINLDSFKAFANVCAGRLPPNTSSMGLVMFRWLEERSLAICAMVNTTWIRHRQKC
jgi:hypothetical protein